MKLIDYLIEFFAKRDPKNDIFDRSERINAKADDEIFLRDIDLGCQAEGRRLVAVVPSPRQYEYSKLGYYCFIHFGMNTFTKREWGTGNESPLIYNPTHLDTDQWAAAMAASGAKGVILTAKHHDGFCLWPSAYTEHSVKNSPVNIDVVGALSDSCKRCGLKFGIYLSPWDMHEKSYGHNKYNEFFLAQLEELCKNYGELFALWFDGARGESAKMDADFDYDWKSIYALIRRLQPQAVITVMGPDVRWIGNEAGVVRESEWSVVPATVLNQRDISERSQTAETATDKLSEYNASLSDIGSRDFLKNFDRLVWYPAEADTSIRRGWFYHKNQRPKPLAKLLRIYYKSVGGNAALLLNVPPSACGLIEKEDVKRLQELGNAVALRHSKPLEYSVSRKELEAIKTPDDTAFKLGIDGIVDLGFDGVKCISEIELREDIRFSQRIEAFSLWLKRKDGSYTLVSRATVIGQKKLIALNPTENNMATGLRLVVEKARDLPVLQYVAVYE